jgi:hydrogenase maturation protease
MTARRIVVVGCGNPDRGDDGAGVAVAKRIEAAHIPGVEVVVDGGDPTALLEACVGTRELFVVDACIGGQKPGMVHRVDIAAQPLATLALGTNSSHALGAADAIELARVLGRLPDRALVYGIEGGVFDTGAPLSPPVSSAVERVAAELLDALL